MRIRIALRWNVPLLASAANGHMLAPIEMPRAGKHRSPRCPSASCSRSFPLSAFSSRRSTPARSAALFGILPAELFPALSLSLSSGSGDS